MQKLFELRKKLHENPETAYEEFKTSEILETFINEIISGINTFTIYKPFKTSLIVVYNGAEKEAYTILRADMDALSISESSLNPVFSLNEGKMHACGHDIHMTSLTGAIKYVAETRPEKNVIFVFQPGEEGAGGAEGLINTGFFDKYNIKRAFALHVTDDYPIGTIASKENVIFAMPREINITFSGKASHAAFPQNGNDALTSAANFLSSIHGILSKSVNQMEAFLFHIGKIEGGEARNVVASSVKLYGTMRALSEEMMNRCEKIVVKAAENIAEISGCRAKYESLGEYLPLINSSDAVEMIKKSAQSQMIDYQEAEIKLVGEDFCYFTKKFGGAIFWLGSRENNKIPVSLHSADFFPSEKVIPYAVNIYSFLIENF